MSLDTIQIKINNITDGGRNTAAEMRAVLTEMTQTLSGGTGSGSADVVTGMTFNTSDGNLTLSTLSGTSISENLDGRYLTGYTDNYITGGTFNVSTGILELTDTLGSSFIVDLNNRFSLTGHTHDFSEITNTGHTHNLSELNNDVGFITGATNTVDFDTHTGDTSIHYNQSSISITESQISDLGDYALNNALTGHTSDTSIHFTKGSINLSDLAITAHTHSQYLTGYTAVYALSGTSTYNVNGNNIFTGSTTYSLISGGLNNIASGQYTTIAGGFQNTTINDYSTVSGGYQNTNSGYYATIIGGYKNTASGRYATIAGGDSNTASDYWATVAGGGINRALGMSSVIVGGIQNTASAHYSTIVGGNQNTASAHYSIVLNGRMNNTSTYGEIIGGLYATEMTGSTTTILPQDRIFGIGIGTSTDNRQDALNIYKDGRIDAPSLAISGITGNTQLITKGYADVNYSAETAVYALSGTSTYNVNGNNTISDTSYNLIAGGFGNSVTGGTYVTIGGGRNNVIGSNYNTISGGYINSASGFYATVAGGIFNRVLAQATFIGGGANNTTSADYGAIGGGYSNTASGKYTTIGGGEYNTASGNYSTVSGGYKSRANGLAATVIGGLGSSASGNYSTASGYYSEANSYGETSIGVFGTTISGNTTTWVGTDRLFNLGNGISVGNRNDAFTIYKDGRIEAPSLAISGITGNTQLITKGYADVNYLTGNTNSRVFEDSALSGTTNIDWNYETFVYTLSGATVFSDINLPPSGYSKTITLYMTGDFAPTYPSGWSTYINGTYNGLVLNTIVAEYVGSSTPFYKVIITQPD